MPKGILIVGGGLSGLYLAHRLKQSDSSLGITVLESRSRLGGRLESAQMSVGESDEVDAFDLGGSWFWPSSQPLVVTLLEELGLESFAQYEEGDLLIERSQTRQAQRLEPRGAGMGDARRLCGGMRSLIEALADRVGRGNILSGRKATGLRLIGGCGAGTRIQATCSNGQCLEAERVVLALPPRLAASNRIEFSPPLPRDLVSSWAATATWMAPHAKYVAVYDRPFWREQKLSGNAHSTAGPLGEIHDATNYDGSLGALFGFFSIPSSARQAQSEDELKSACRSQLARLFGDQAVSPRDEWIRDWSSEEDTATKADQTVAVQAKRVGALKVTPDEDESQWHELVLGAGSEWSPTFPGYIAGALDAADRAMTALLAA